MAVPVWVPGQVLAASDVNTWFVPLAAVKTVDQSVTSSTTLVNDNVLAVPVAASSTYEFRLFCWFQAAAGGDFKFQFAGPAGEPTRLLLTGWDRLRRGLAVALALTKL
jgi:hypothetical protein